MSIASHLAIIIATSAMYYGAPAGSGQIEVEVGSQVVCNTQKQLERFAELFFGDAESAVNEVNNEAEDQSGCYLAMVAHVRGAEIATVQTRTGAYRIFRILVLGIVTDSGLHNTVPKASYSIELIYKFDV